MQKFDCLIIGGGPAGLTAAIYLGRYYRKIIVVDGGSSRARWIPTSHNYLGFDHGISGEALLDRLRRQAESYGAILVTEYVTAYKPDSLGQARAGSGQVGNPRKFYKMLIRGATGS
jgi:thioredoxin reductase (NADPH)